MWYAVTFIAGFAVGGVLFFVYGKIVGAAALHARQIGSQVGSNVQAAAKDLAKGL